MVNDEKLIKKIKKDYVAGAHYKEICEKYGIKNNELKNLISKKKWKRNGNKSRSNAMKKNKNSKGHGGKKGNKNALVTGAYETIYDDNFTDEEKNLLTKFDFENEKQQLLQEIKLLTIKQRRINKKIDELKNGSKMTISTMTKGTFNNNEAKTITTAENTMNFLNRLEEASTKISEAKRRCIDSYHKIDNDNKRLELELIKMEKEEAKEESSSPENISDDSFIKALENTTEEVWNDD